MKEEISVNYISEQLGVDPGTALKVLDTFWDVIILKLENDGEAMIEGLGRFYIEENQLRFEAGAELINALNS